MLVPQVHYERSVWFPELTFHLSDWSFVDGIYFSFISLSTIGFGDLVPSNTPPLKFATTQQNESVCLIELLNPIPDDRNASCLKVIHGPFRCQFYSINFTLDDVAKWSWRYLRCVSSMRLFLDPFWPYLAWRSDNNDMVKLFFWILSDVYSCVFFK